MNTGTFFFVEKCVLARASFVWNFALDVSVLIVPHRAPDVC